MSLNAASSAFPFTELESWAVDYRAVLDGLPDELHTRQQALRDRLEPLWGEVYLRHSPGACNLQVVNDEAGTFILDCTWTVFGGESGAEPDLPDDRVVAAIAVSRDPGKRRPASRIHGFPRGPLTTLLPELLPDFDRGHHLAHASGGGVDINLYPQLASVNRGHDAKGKIYRAMERQVAENPGTLSFSRPLYFGVSDHPAAIDFGVMRADGSLWQEVFPNVRSLEHLALLDRARKFMRKRGLTEWPEDGLRLLEKDT